MNRYPGLVVFIMLSLLVAGASGCSAFRAEVGFGTGGGVTVKVPAVLHTGLGGGQFYHLGHNYSDGWRAGGVRASPLTFRKFDWDFHLVLLFMHWSEERDRMLFAQSYTQSYDAFDRSIHRCFVVPVIFEPDHASSYALEVSAGLFFTEIRLGFRPWCWFHKDHWSRASPESTEEAESEPEQSL